MKGFNLSSQGAGGGSVSTPVGPVPPFLATLSQQGSINPLLAKKSSLTISTSADITIDMNVKKSPMQR
jgi:hypothetical protein